MHDSGRMLLALYANGVLRLWNMLDARCLFKKKVGMSAQNVESEDDEADVKDANEEEKEDISRTKKLETEKFRQEYRSFDRQRAEKVMWEPTQGKHYAVLFSHILEIFTVECDDPIHSITFDTNQTSFTYVGRLQLVTCDDKGRMSVFSNVDKNSGVLMRLIKTDYIRLKSLQASPDCTFVSALTNNSLAFWSADELRSAFDQEADDGL